MDAKEAFMSGIASIVSDEGGRPKRRYVVARHDAISSHTRAAGVSMHGRRTGNYNLEHCDVGRRSLVMAAAPLHGGTSDSIDAPFDPFNVGRCLDKATAAAGASRHGGAAIGTELLFIASDAFFERPGWTAPYVDIPPSSANAIDDAASADATSGNATSDDVATAPADGPFEYPTIDCAAIIATLASWMSERDWAAGFLSASDNTDAAHASNPHISRTQDVRRTDQSALEKGKLKERWNAARDLGDERTRAWLDRFDPDRIVAWMATIVMAADAVPSWTVACFRLDLDEEVPHFSVFVVPTYEKTTKHTRSTRVSVRRHFDKRKQLSALQDWIGDVCKPFGLVRGEKRSVSGARHVPPAAYRDLQRRIAEADATMAEARGEMEKAKALHAEAEQLVAEARTLKAEAAAAKAEADAKMAEAEAEKVAARTLRDERTVLRDEAAALAARAGSERLVAEASLADAAETEERVARQLADVRVREEAVGERETKVAAREERIATAEAELTDRATELDARQEALNDRQTTIAAREDALKEKRTATRFERKVIDKERRDLGTERAALRTERRAVEAAGTNLKAREAECREQQARLDERLDGVDRLHKDLERVHANVAAAGAIADNVLATVERSGIELPNNAADELDAQTTLARARDDLAGVANSLPKEGWGVRQDCLTEIVERWALERNDAAVFASDTVCTDAGADCPAM